jgi:predicted enzyme related to lactoylglutathione lyase
MRTATLELPARDLQRADAFYRELLGFDRSDERPLPVLFQRRAAEEAPSAEPARLSLGGLSCLERALEVAWERGGCIVKCAQWAGRGLWRATIVDTEGNVVSLYARA